MKRIFLAFLLVISTNASAGVRYVEGRTVSNSFGDIVTDGDTVRVEPLDGGPVMKIRMMGIDTPESKLPVRGGVVGQQPWGDQAAAMLASMLPLGTRVTVEDHGTDRYGRTLGRLYVEDHFDVNYAMVRSGWALPYIYCTGEDCVPGYLERENVAAYLNACEAARQEGIGVFDPYNPLDEAPFVFRLRMQRRRPEKYVGDFRTRRLYRPEEYHLVDVCRIVFFSNTEQANALGFYFQN
jgi:endonuclease YncB( thermonuclease family)